MHNSGKVTTILGVQSISLTSLVLQGLGLTAGKNYIAELAHRYI